MKCLLASLVSAFGLVLSVGAQGDPGAVTRARAEALVFPEVTFKDTSLSSAVEYLRQMTAKSAGGKGMNFVELYPREFGEETTLTLSLSGVPLAAVLKYVGESSGVAVEYQAHAIVLKVAPEAGAAVE